MKRKVWHLWGFVTESVIVIDLIAPVLINTIRHLKFCRSNPLAFLTVTNNNCHICVMRRQIISTMPAIQTLMKIFFSLSDCVSFATNWKLVSLQRNLNHISRLSGSFQPGLVKLHLINRVVCQKKHKRLWHYGNVGLMNWC